MVGKLCLITHFVPNFPLLNPKKEKEKERYATVSPASSGSLCRIQKQTNKTNQLSWTQKKQATATNIHNTDSEFCRRAISLKKTNKGFFVLFFLSIHICRFHSIPWPLLRSHTTLTTPSWSVQFSLSSLLSNL